MTPEEAKQRAAELIADNQLDLAEVVAEWLMLQQKEPGKVKPVFSVDWSLLKATQESLREHMALVKAAQESEQQFRAEVAAALPESWYADSPLEFRVQNMVEQWQKLHKREKEVAAALRELRDMWWRRSQMLVITKEDEAMKNTLSDVLNELDATITKLGWEETK